jgi:hypothetical protein
MNVSHKVDDGNVSGLLVTFFFFSALAVALGRMESMHSPEIVLISVFAGSVAVALFRLLRVCVDEKTREWSGRVLRALAIGFLLHGAITVSFMGIYDWFGNFRDITPTGTIDALTSNRESLRALESAVVAGGASVPSLNFWKSKLTVIILAASVALFLFSLLSSGSWFMR